MTRSPDSLIPFDAGQPTSEKRDDKAFNCRQEGEANLRAATQVNAVSASLAPPVITPIQLELIPGRACHDSEVSENQTDSPGRCIGRRHAETEHQVNRRDPVRSGGGYSAR
jgi:hypothetical protein